MKRKKHTVEQIISKLRQAEVELAKGSTVPQAARKLGITDQTYYRWRSEFTDTPSEAFRGPGKRRACDEDLERLRRENERLRMGWERASRRGGMQHRRGQ